MNRIEGLESLIGLTAFAWLGLIVFLVYVGRKYQSNKTRIID